MRRGPARWAAVGLLLAGLVVMHGIGLGHGGAMATLASTHAGMPPATLAAAVGASVEQPVATGVATATGVMGSMGAMAMCVAVLTALGLLLRWLVRRRWRMPLSPRGSGLRGASHRRALDRVRGAPPDLDGLGISRT